MALFHHRPGGSLALMYSHPTGTTADKSCEPPMTTSPKLPAAYTSFAIAPFRAFIAVDMDLDKIIEETPGQMSAPKEPGKPWLSKKVRKIDFAYKDALNRALGKLGEEFVVHLERQRLVLAGRDDLAGKVKWAAMEWGDGLGFDVLSFDAADESERLIEVKTTGLGKYFPFYVTATEVRCSEDVAERFHLFRVFDFGRQARAYVLVGSLRASCLLEPTQYRAAIAGAGMSP
jgi:uncharacterized protein DUF3883